MDRFAAIAVGHVCNIKNQFQSDGSHPTGYVSRSLMTGFGWQTVKYSLLKLGAGCPLSLDMKWSYRPRAKFG